MSASTESYFIRSGRLKRLVSAVGQLKSHADAAKDRELLSVASLVQNFITEADYLVGIPDESYPTKFSGKELNLDGMDDSVTIRAELKTEELERVLASVTQAAKRLRDAGDKTAETADLVAAIIMVWKGEKYQGKTHQVASFDPMGERLGFLP